MSYLDATAPQLAAAWGGSVRGDQALQDFLALFDAKSVAYWLGSRHEWFASEPEPPFFPYLVLTCVIAVNDIAGVDAGTNNFRTRLGQTLGIPELQSVGGVNPLWKALERWSHKRRSRGLPVREIVLPDPGTMTLIGYAVRMAFPSWRDRRIFSSILEGIPERIRSSPSRLVYELKRTHRSFDIPTAISEALDDFAQRLGSGDTMLTTHRFWSLVASINSALENEAGVPRRASSSVELRFGGYDQDEPDFSLHEGNGARNDSPWSDIVKKLLADERSPIAKGLRHGYAVFNRSAGCWVCDEAGLDPVAMCLVITRRDSEARRWRLNARWRDLGDDWEISDGIDGNVVASILKLAGGAIREIAQPKLSGGVRFKQGVYLGQPGFLPDIDRPGNGNFAIARLFGDDDGLEVDRNGLLTAERPTQGIWRVSVGESGDRTDITLSLERHSPEPAAFSEPPRSDSWRPDRELRSQTADRPVGSNAPILLKAKEAAVSAEAICEAVFSKAGTGWQEGELVELIKGALPSPMMVWDVIRSLQEAGWLDSFSSKVWRGRRWHCRPPTFVMISEKEAIVDGAIGGAVLGRLADLARPRGLSVERLVGASEYSPPTVLVAGNGIGALASAMEWRCVQLDGLPSANSADQWLEDGRTQDGRRLASTWSHTVGLVLERSTEDTVVKVERWVRERADEADLYLIRDRGGNVLKKTSSRVLAVLEGHRLNRVPLFEKRSDSVVRIRKSGHLPLPVARHLRLRSSMASGPVADGSGTWKYLYSSVGEVDIWLRQFLGSGLKQEERHSTATATKAVEWRHRGGRRPAWNAISFGYEK
jgi:hypothetical protein